MPTSKHDEPPPGAHAGDTARVPAKVWGGTRWLIAGRLVSSACTLVTLYLLASHLSSEGFGRLTFYLALFLVLDSFVDLGSGQAAVQCSADNPTQVWGAVRVARAMRVVTGCIGIALVGGGALAFEGDGGKWVLLASFYPLTHVLEVSTLIFKNEIAWARPVLVRMGASLASLSFVLIFLVTGATQATLYLLAVALGSTLGNIGLYWIARDRVPRSGPKLPWAPFVRSAIPMGVAGLCQQAYFYVDNLFVRPLCGDAELGRYNLAVRLMSYGLMVAVYATLAALPWLRREHARDRLGEALGRLGAPLVLFAAFAFGAAWPWTEQILALFGEEFRPASASLRWLFLACLCVYVGASLLTGVVACGASKSVLGIALAGLAVNLAGNAWLVPTHGSEGAAIATLATEASVALGAGLVLARRGVHVPNAIQLVSWAGALVTFGLTRWVSGALPFD